MWYFCKNGKILEQNIKSNHFRPKKNLSFRTEIRQIFETLPFPHFHVFANNDVLERFLLFCTFSYVIRGIKLNSQIGMIPIIGVSNDKPHGNINRVRVDHS